VNPREIRWGEYAYLLIEQHYQQITRQRQSVIADRDPEPLHKMRVGLRRLRVTLQTFAPVLSLPVKSENRALRQLGRQLSTLRDLDVQIATLTEDYRPLLPTVEQQALDQQLQGLGRQRRKAFRKVKKLLRDRLYHRFFKTYKHWLAKPEMPASDVSVQMMTAQVLVEQLRSLLAHPAWRIACQQPLAPHEFEQLHELRKTIKKTRYQAEFFAPIHSQAFCRWLTELKLLQNTLGTIQDMQVLATWLQGIDTHLEHLPTLYQQFLIVRQQVLADWDILRQSYLTSDRQQQLQTLVGTLPPPFPEFSEPEASGSLAAGSSAGGLPPSAPEQ
jgi:CHAD domain-containing protein